MWASELVGATAAFVAEADLHPCISLDFLVSSFFEFYCSFLPGWRHGADCYLEQPIFVLYVVHVAVFVYLVFPVRSSRAVCHSVFGTMLTCALCVCLLDVECSRFFQFLLCFFLVGHSVASASSSFSCMSCKCSF